MRVSLTSPNSHFRYWSTTGSGQQVVTDVPRDNKAAIINSIATSYALQRPRFTVTPVPRVSSKIAEGKGRYSDGKSDWPYYQTYRQTAEAQKAQIFEDIQRKMANTSSVSSMGYSPLNATNPADQRQHRLRMKHRGLTSKGKRLRTREFVNRAMRVVQSFDLNVCYFLPQKYLYTPFLYFDVSYSNIVDCIHVATETLIIIYI